MKKVVALVLVLVLSMALFAGCGGEKTPSDTTTPPDSSTPSDTTQPDNTADPGKTYNLVVVNHDASTSMCEEYIETLCNEMSEASGGQLTFDFNPGGSLLGATETLDGVKNGTADICWSCTSFFGGRFPISEFINLCANGINSARMATEVYNKMYEEMPELQSELSGWKIIALHSCSYGPISTINKKIVNPEDFKGMQIRTAGTVAAKYIEALGATPITMPTSDVYESVSKGVIDGFTNDWHNIDCFKLYEPIDYCLDMPVSHTSCFVMMSQDAYDRLPADIQAVIDDFSAGYAGAMAGYWWDSCNYWVGEEMKANGVEVYEPSEELRSWAQSDEIVQPIHDWYVQYLNDAGLDGQAIYDKCMAIVEEVAPSHTGDWDTEFNYKDWPYTVETYGK